MTRTLWFSSGDKGSRTQARAPALRIETEPLHARAPRFRHAQLLFTRPCISTSLKT